MVEHPTDSLGPSPLIQGGQLEAWRIVATRLDLIDAYSLPRKFIDAHLTRQVAHGHRLDQSRLNRFYLSDKAQWLHIILSLEHV